MVDGIVEIFNVQFFCARGREPVYKEKYLNDQPITTFTTEILVGKMMEQLWK